MPKKRKTALELKHKFESTGPFSKSGHDPLPLDKYEKISAVCELFCQGKTASEIADDMKSKKYRGKRAVSSREEPYEMIRYATLRKWIIFRPPPHLVYTYAIKERYNRLTDVEVVRTTVVSDVARRAAEKLVKMLQEYGTSSETVHIGLSGGLTMREFASAFAEEICQPTENLPKKIVLHGLVAGFDPDDPTTVPSAFYTYFLMNPVIQIEAEFKGFNATPMVKLKELDGVMNRDEIRDAHAAVADIDIFVTTGADCREHSTLFKRMQQSPDSVGTLNDHDWVGDIFWRPIGMSGPIMAKTDIRAMTLLELDQLPNLIDNNKNVLLVLGPCPDPSCNKPKDDILAAVLNQKERYITHLVVDSRTGGQFVNKWIKDVDSMR